MPGHSIEVGTPVRFVLHDDDRRYIWGRYIGRMGVVERLGGRMSEPRHGEDWLYAVDFGFEQRVVIGERHLEVLRPDLLPQVLSTRFALTASDVIYREQSGSPYPLAV